MRPIQQITDNQPSVTKHKANGYFWTKVWDFDTFHIDIIDHDEHSANETILAITISLISVTLGILLNKGKIIEHANELITCGNMQ